MGGKANLHRKSSIDPRSWQYEKNIWNRNRDKAGAQYIFTVNCSSGNLFILCARRSVLEKKMRVNGQLLEMPSVSFEALYQILRRMLLLVIKNHLGKISFFQQLPLWGWVRWNLARSCLALPFLTPALNSTFSDKICQMGVNWKVAAADCSQKI